MADAAAELDEGGIKRTLKDLFAGAAGGVAQVLLGSSNIDVFIWYPLFVFDDMCYPVSSFAAISGQMRPKMLFLVLCWNCREVADTMEIHRTAVW